MTFWSGAKLLKEVSRQVIVSPFQKDQIDCNAITLTLGPEVFVTPDFGMDPRSNLKQHLKASKTCQINGKNHTILGGPVKIPAGQFAYLMTEEIVKIPFNVMGFISLKSGVKWKGLINVSGFHVDPGFQGKLIYSVYNAGPSDIHLARGEDVFLLWLADLDETADKKSTKSGSNPLLEIPSKIISEVDRPIHSLPKLSEKLEMLSSDFESLKTELNLSIKKLEDMMGWVAKLGGLLVAVATIIVAILLKP